QRALAIDQARWALNQAVGLPVDAPTAVVDVRERPAVPEADEALRLARATNPVLASLLEEQQRLEESARALARSRLPRFEAGGAIDYSSATIVQPQRVGSGFVGFTWDLGTDTRREAEIAAARHAAEQNRIPVGRALAVLVLAGVAAAVWVVRRDRTPPHYTGFVEGEERVIRSEVTGRVLEVIFAEGAQVPPNAVLARLDDADIQTRLLAKHEELDVAEADIRRQQQQVELSESTWK